ncbi:hypothetical protein SISNIDRAFT_549342 [Sistotremastrum niveocremeum HHB9708]|uniref:Dystroglycan-type cadherin-like domain-containing protein n=1 Tax=Sistotremastrum niveocremeum HHB9708 TaxID=1314777 RepID=A0A164VGB5_9AGAM|nr:hypothetical protein SISNIDRAFT_549342 [Sistotremastrum niveocremeum HHB9708]
MHITGIRSFLITCFTVAISSYVAAQTTPSFSWTFSPPSTQLIECNNVTITITPSANSVPTPPFYMVAYEVNGIATTSLIGTDPSDLSWEVNHVKESNVLLEVIDANGSSGGVTSLFHIEKGPVCTCQTPGTWSPVEIHPNVTSLNTRDALELDFQGGTPPYSVTITSEGLAVVSNLTLAPNEHEFVWTDQLSPGSIVIATVHDANDQYAVGTSIITLGGSPGLNCGNNTSSTTITTTSTTSGSSGSQSSSTTSSPSSGSSVPTTSSSTSTSSPPPGSLPTNPSSGTSSTTSSSTFPPISNTVSIPTSPGGTPSIPPTTPPSQPSQPPPNHKPVQIGVGTAGGVVAACLLLGLLWFCLRRRKRLPGTQPLEEAPETTPISYGAAPVPVTYGKPAPPAPAAGETSGYASSSTAPPAAGGALSSYNRDGTVNIGSTTTPSPAQAPARPYGGQSSYNPDGTVNIV